MSNVIDYLQWRGDITFDVSEFNDVDNLIFSILSYLDFPFVKNEMTLSEACKKYFEIREKNLVSKSRLSSDLMVDIENLLSECSASERFKDVRIGDFISMFEENKETQFSATTFFIDDDTMYVAFRGTDDTIVGFKEDFNMSYSKSVPSQENAVKYMNRIMEKYDKNRVYVGGHSKGGNLAVYSVAMMDSVYLPRIIKVYNNDGPGFSEHMVDNRSYINIVPKVKKILPESSIIGRLMDDHEKCFVIKAKGANGLEQHNGFSWQVKGKSFVHADDFSMDSMFVDSTLSNWLYSLNDEERKEFVEQVYNIITDYADINTVSEISENRMKFIYKFLRGMGQIKDDEKEQMQKTIMAFIKSRSSARKKARAIKKNRSIFRKKLFK